MDGSQVSSLAGLGLTKLGPRGGDRYKDVSQALIDANKWDAFWDAPLYMDDKDTTRAVGMPRNPDEIKRATATYKAQSCDVKTDGTRLMVAFPGVSLGLFAGQLQFTVFKGSNLIEQEVIAKTDQDNVAYLYNAGLKGLAIGPGSRMMWRDLANLPAEYQFGGARNDGEVAVKTANRLLIAERGSAEQILTDGVQAYYVSQLATLPEKDGTWPTMAYSPRRFDPASLPRLETNAVHA